MTTTDAVPRKTGDARDLPTVHRMMPTPIGSLTLVADEVGLRAVTWPDEGGSRVGLAGRLTGTSSGENNTGTGDVDSENDGAATPANPVAEATLDTAETQLAEYFAGERQSFDLPMHLVGTEFQQETWRALAQIPYGQTISYGEQAGRLGRPKAVRAVGAANGRNPLSVVLPCHRVVGASGDLTGFAAGIDTKRWLLDHESGQAPLPLG